MNREIRSLLSQLLTDLAETRKTVCVDGDCSYQHGFFSGYGLAQSVVAELARRHGLCFDLDEGS